MKNFMTIFAILVLILTIVGCEQKGDGSVITDSSSDSGSEGIADETVITGSLLKMHKTDNRLSLA